MNLLQILVLGIVQGAAELLPVSSSAHVIIAEKLMGLDPSSPEMTFILVMLHTGTMFAVIAYFWKAWARNYFSSAALLWNTIQTVALATVATGILGVGLQFVIEKVYLKDHPHAEIEDIFSNLYIVGGALLAAGLLILVSGIKEEKKPGAEGICLMKSLVIGLVQGICLPFRGFSRSGATISTGLLLGVERRKIEEFSFALAVVLTPPIILKEWLRLVKTHPESAKFSELVTLLTPGFFGMVCSFAAGLVALWLLSSLLEAGRWKYFGFYCLAASVGVFLLAYRGF